MRETTAVSEVHEPRALSDSYDSLMFETEEDVSQSVEGFDGRPMANDWVPLKVHWVAPESPIADDTSTDFPSLQGIHVMSAGAADPLLELIEGRVELLPLEVEGGAKLYAVNVLGVCDALDEDASELKPFPHNPSRIMAIVSYAFDPAKLAGETIFRIRQKPKGRVFITDAFVRRIRKAGLRGLDLNHPVWKAENSAQGTGP
jgi:uncharacterized protein DUF1629